MSTNKQVFKEGDRVYLYPLGWGDIEYKSDYDYSIYFKSIEDKRYIGGDVRSLLSFTEYRLDGFSQERPEELPNRGQIVWARDSDNSEWRVGHFIKKENGLYLITAWDPFDDEDLRSPSYPIITTKNPYENREA